MNRALVLAGGGSRGAWQAGAAAVLWRVFEQGNESFSIVSGTSVGALNAAVLVQSGPHHMLELWRHIRGDGDVFRGGSPLGAVGAAVRFLFDLPVYDTSPLRRLIARELDDKALAAATTRLFVHATAWRRRILGTWTNTSPDLLEAVLASAAIPLAFPPIRIRGVEWVDGGVLGNVPIRTAIEAGAKEVVVLLPDAKPTPRRQSYADFLVTRDPEDDPEGYEYREAASDLVDIIMDSQLQADLEGVPHGVTVHVLRPGRDLGHTLDFRPAHIRKMLEIGRREAVHWLATTSGVPKPR